MTSPRTRSFAVIGLGTFGATVAGELMRFGNYVIGIDRDSAAVNRIADRLNQAIIADARDEDAIREAGVGDCDVAIVAMASDLEASIVSVITVKMAGVEQVWAKAASKMHHRILSKMGVDRIVHPQAEMGYHIAQMLHNPMVRDYVSLGNNYHVVTVVVPERLEGETLSGLNMPDRFDIRCVGVMRGSEFRSNGEEECVLAKGDIMLLLGQRSNLRRFADDV